MTTFEDVGELYIKYQNDNGKQSEVDFYKNQLQKSIEELRFHLGNLGYIES